MTGDLGDGRGGIDSNTMEKFFLPQIVPRFARVKLLRDCFIVCSACMWVSTSEVDFEFFFSFLFPFIDMIR